MDFQSEDDIITEEAREKKWDKWCKEVEQVGDKAVYRKGKKIKSATKIVNVGTVLHHSCLVSRLARAKSYRTILRRAVILEEGQTIDDIFESKLWTECKKIYFDDKIENARDKAKEFYEQHKDEMKYPVLWEEKWDFFVDIAEEYWKDRKSFMSELMNDAISIGDKWFKSIRTQTVDEIADHIFEKTMLIIDPASTKTKRSDSTAMIVGSLGSNGFKYCRELVREKLSFDEYCELAVELVKKYEDITHIDIEKNTFRGADVSKIKELMEKDPYFRSRKIQFINDTSTKNKDERISTIIDEVNNGQIIFVDNNKDFVQEILDFQGQQYSLHDDCPDVTARFSKIIGTINPVCRVRVIDRKELGI